MIGRGKKLNGTLREMWIGIIVWGGALRTDYGLVCEG